MAGAVGAGLPGGTSSCVDICRAKLPGVQLACYKRSQTRNVTEAFTQYCSRFPQDTPVKGTGAASCS